MRKAVAKNPSLPDFVLIELATDRDLEVRKLAIKDPRIPPAVLAEIALELGYVEVERPLVDLVGELERLTALRASEALTDEEFTQAKVRLLGPDRP